MGRLPFFFLLSLTVRDHLLATAAFLRLCCAPLSLELDCACWWWLPAAGRAGSPAGLRSLPLAGWGSWRRGIGCCCGRVLLAAAGWWWLCCWRCWCWCCQTRPCRRMLFPLRVPAPARHRRRPCTRRDALRPRVCAQIRPPPQKQKPHACVGAHHRTRSEITPAAWSTPTQTILVLPDPLPPPSPPLRLL